MNKKFYYRVVITLLYMVGIFIFPCLTVNGTQIHSTITVELLSSEPKFLFGFSNFAISSSGCLAIASGHMPDNVIAVYDTNGSFLYGYSVDDPGAIAVSWEDNNVAVYLVRSNKKVILNRDGTVLSQGTFDDPEYSQITANTKLANGETYIAKHWLVNHKLLRWGSYNRLVHWSNGQEYVLFETEPLIPILFMCGICILSIGIIFLSIRLVIRKNTKKHGGTSNLFQQ